MPAPRGFDWSGVLVGHWQALSRSGVDKHRHTLWKCVSRCGTVEQFQGYWLSMGATATCLACRGPNTCPNGARVLPEHQAERFKATFDGAYMYVDKHIVGEMCKDWDAHGEPALKEWLTRSTLGTDFGWRVEVESARHMAAGQDRTRTVKLNAWRKGERAGEFVIYPPRGTYQFNIVLSTGRNNPHWGKVQELLLAACQPRPTPEAAPTPTPATAAAQPAQASGLVPHEEKLTKLISGIQKAIEIGRDARAAADLRDELVRRVEAARRIADPLEAARAAAAERHANCRGELDEAQNRVTELSNLLKDAVAKRDKWATSEDKTRREVEFATNELAGPAAALAAATRDLQAADEEEEQRRKTLEKAGDVAVLLAALEKLGV